MRLFIKTAVFVGTVLTLVTSCSNDFLQDNLSLETYPTGLSNIYISPNWPSSNYYFKMPTIKEADFEIVSQPSWLKTASENGHIADSIGVLTCSAETNPDYEKVGVYIEYMTIRAEGKNYKLPIAYINEGDPKAEVASNVSLTIYGGVNPYLPIANNGSGILIWGIEHMPDWLDIDSSQLKSTDFYLPSNSTFNVPLRIKLDTILSENMTGTMVLSTNDKDHPTISVQVTANLGKPGIVINNPIDFSFTETTKTLNIFNAGEGYLVWEISNIPKWLTVTPLHGMSNPYATCKVTLHCDRTKLAPGQNSATIQLKTNYRNYPVFTIKVNANAPGSTSTIQTVEGNIIEAKFNKNTNTLYYITSSPNKLVAYDVNEKKVLNEIELSITPTCFDISEDWTTSAVGHNQLISAINLSNNTITKTLTVNYRVNSIAWAKDHWFGYTQKNNDFGFSNLHWLNTADGTKYDDNSFREWLDGSSIIKKVPNQPYLIAIRKQTSPNGFFAYDIGSMSIKSYSHREVSDFWFSENGDLVFFNSREVFRTTSSTESTDTFNATMNPIAGINPGNEHWIRSMYQSDHKLWVILNDYKSGNIYQLEDTRYSLVKTYKYDYYYQPNAQTTPLIISPQLVFANKEGTEIAVLQKSDSNDTWIIQFIAVK